MIDSSYGRKIIDLMKRVDICKKIMNGNLICMDKINGMHPMNCVVSRDTFKYPWTDMEGFTPDDP